MKFKVIYPVFGVDFTHEALTLHELYETVCAIIKREKLMYPDQERAMSDFMEICLDLAKGGTDAFLGVNFSVHAIKPEN